MGARVWLWAAASLAFVPDGATASVPLPPPVVPLSPSLALVGGALGLSVGLLEGLLEGPGVGLGVGASERFLTTTSCLGSNNGMQEGGLRGEEEGEGEAALKERRRVHVHTTVP